jgi:hypothetical protein
MITKTVTAAPAANRRTGRRRSPSVIRPGAFLFAGLLATLSMAAEPSPKPPTKADVPAVSSGQDSTESVPGKVDESARPQLDLAALESRLRETDAIGVFTKLTLKNQVDDLLDRFRAFYEGRLEVPLAELRQPYDLLLLKTMTVVQDGDPALASAIASSREAIWEILADPHKFKALAAGT